MKKRSAKFYNTLPILNEVAPHEADLAWFLYYLIFDEASQCMQLTQNRVVYTKYEDTMLRLNNNEPCDTEIFVERLQKKLNSKLTGTDLNAPFLGDEDGSPVVL